MNCKRQQAADWRGAGQGRHLTWVITQTGCMLEKHGKHTQLNLDCNRHLRWVIRQRGCKLEEHGKHTQLSLDCNKQTGIKMENDGRHTALGLQKTNRLQTGQEQGRCAPQEQAALER